jgi:hypothetical protein
MINRSRLRRMACRSLAIDAAGGLVGELVWLALKVRLACPGREAAISGAGTAIRLCHVSSSAR